MILYHIVALNKASKSDGLVCGYRQLARNGTISVVTTQRFNHVRLESPIHGKREEDLDEGIYQHVIRQ